MPKDIAETVIENDNLTRIGVDGEQTQDDANSAEISYWIDIDESDALGEAAGNIGLDKTMQCLNTQERRNLKMKKHRRQKRKKKMLLKLKSSGKL